MAETDSILNRGVEGRGVYAGALSFLLTTLFGGFGLATGPSLA
jgi:hypothetical protein